jgi:toxin-antitoxin system PIN domain toxin
VISVDTNILLYSLNADCAEHQRARAFMSELGTARDVVLCELVLVELYLLLRSPAVLARPLAAPAAVALCQGYRSNPRWRLVECAPVMTQVWDLAVERSASRRRIIDVRLALTLKHHGVTQLATRNLADFQGLGFERVWDPLLD